MNPKPAFLLLLLIPTLGVAETTLLDWVPKEAEFVVAVDIRQALDSSLGKELLTRTNVPDLPTKLEFVKNLSGVDLMKDLDRGIVFGRIKDEDSVVVMLEGRIAPEKLVTLLKLNQRYATSTVGTATVHEWFDSGENKMKYATFVDGKWAAMTGKREALELALGTHGGKEGFAAAVPPGTVPEAGAAAWGAIRSPERILPAGARRDTLQADWAFGALDLADTTTTISASAHTASPEAAAQWKELLEGAVSLAQLQRTQPELTRLGDAAKVSLNPAAQLATISVPLENTAIIKALQESGKIQ